MVVISIPKQDKNELSHSAKGFLRKKWKKWIFTDGLIYQVHCMYRLHVAKCIHYITRVGLPILQWLEW